MKISHIFTVACLSAFPAQADTPLTLDAFRAYVTGSTFTHAFEGETPFGFQIYGGDQTLGWTSYDDPTFCDAGSYAQGPGDSICLTYPSDGFEVCWTFFKVPGGMRAEGDDGRIFDMALTNETSPCSSPDGSG